MASHSDHEFVDTVGGALRPEDVAFAPMRSNGFPDRWTGFFVGILIGISGGALVPHGPWLSGLMILSGYGSTYYALRFARGRVGRSLRFGFGFAALAGASLLGGSIVFPEATGALIAAAAERHLIFCGLALLPWGVAAVRYIYSLARPRSSSAR